MPLGLQVLKSMSEDRKQLKIENLKVWFGDPKSPVRAVDTVSLEVEKGTTVALVGESGCGKSVTALSVMKLVPVPPGMYKGGTVELEGRDVLSMTERELQEARGAEVSYVFQEPGSSLNPVFTVGWQIGEALKLHRPEVDVRKEVVELLRMVGIPDPEQRTEAYPHELSGGMQQRAMIAMALACRPSLLIADEPTTALDVTIQAQILELLGELQQELGMSVLLITHNLGIVADVADKVYVMYAGQIVESGPAREVIASPMHPYSVGLLAAVPRLGGVAGELRGIPGSVPDMRNVPIGCRFAERCRFADEVCRATMPELEKKDGRAVRCYHPQSE
jgi:oligopeptide/dipeptide ABC transporter ATP-binding protein